MSEHLPPPGWYLDPGVPNTQRYWDGLNWTNFTSPLYIGTLQSVPIKRSAKSTVAIAAGAVVGVVVVLVLLIAAAVPVAHKQINQTQSYVEHDVGDVAVSMQAYYEANHKFPTTSQEFFSDRNPQPTTVTPGDQLTISTDGVSGYCVSGIRPGSPYANLPKVYDSQQGGLLNEGAQCSSTFVYMFYIPYRVS